MKRLISDFSGPLMDISERHYRLYIDCLSEVNNTNETQNKTIKYMPKEIFWRLKRMHISQEEIGIKSGLNSEQSIIFASLYKAKTNLFEYMSYDQPAKGAIMSLETARNYNIDLVLLTMRRVTELEFAFSRTEFGKFFQNDHVYCLNDDYEKTSDIEDKPLLLNRALHRLPCISDTWLVGDTEADIIAAKTYKLKAVCVLSGSRDYDRLKQHDPDLIVENISEVIDLMIKS